jgi:hypothetical protein
MGSALRSHQLTPCPSTGSSAMTGERIGLPHRGNVTFVRILAVDRAPMLSPQNCPEKAADRFVGRMAGNNT